MSSRPTSWSNAIQSWYDETNDFTYAVGPTSPQAVVGHYTQVRGPHEKTSGLNSLKGKILQEFLLWLSRLRTQSWLHEESCLSTSLAR